jgi:hypothetical protein
MTLQEDWAGAPLCSDVPTSSVVFPVAVTVQMETISKKPLILKGLGRDSNYFYPNIDFKLLLELYFLKGIWISISPCVLVKVFRIPFFVKHATSSSSTWVRNLLFDTCNLVVAA